MRRGINSPVQGAASVINFLAARDILIKIDNIYKDQISYKWNDKKCKFVLKKPKILYCSSVHDSLKYEIDKDLIPEIIPVIQQSTQVDIPQQLKDLYNIKIKVPLKTDFELGDSGEIMKGWDADPKSLKPLIQDCLNDKKERLDGKRDTVVKVE